MLKISLSKFGENASRFTLLTREDQTVCYMTSKNNNSYLISGFNTLVFRHDQTTRFWEFSTTSSSTSCNSILGSLEFIFSTPYESQESWDSYGVLKMDSSDPKMELHDVEDEVVENSQKASCLVLPKH